MLTLAGRASGCLSLLVRQTSVFAVHGASGFAVESSTSWHLAVESSTFSALELAVSVLASGSWSDRAARSSATPVIEMAESIFGLRLPSGRTRAELARLWLGCW